MKSATALRKLNQNFPGIHADFCGDALISGLSSLGSRALKEPLFSGETDKKLRVEIGAATVVNRDEGVAASGMPT
jgi:hypothetical protein